jgi:hypothetical protein
MNRYQQCRRLQQHHAFIRATGAIASRHTISRMRNKTLQNVLSGIVLSTLVAACGGARSAPPQTSPAVVPGQNSGLSGAAAVNVAQSSLPGCPGGNGIRIAVTSGTSADTSVRTPDSASRANAADTSARSGRADSTNILNAVVNERQSIDTTIVFNVAQKNWTRTNLAASISAGLADEARGGYAICAGVSALIPSATLTIRGARGRVHFAATLQDLLNSIRSGPGTASP